MPVSVRRTVGGGRGRKGVVSSECGGELLIGITGVRMEAN